MLNELSTQKRLLLATAISIIFFIAYDYFFIPKKTITDTNKTAIANEAPKINVEDINKTSSIISHTKTSKNIVSIVGTSYTASIDELGRISSFVLSNSKFQDLQGKQISLINTNHAPLPLEIRFSDPSLNEEAFKTSYSANLSDINASSSSNTVVLTQILHGTTVTKTIKFYPTGEYDLNVKLSKNEDYFITPGFRPNIVVDGYTVHGALLRKTDGSLDILKDGSVKGNEKLSGIDIAANSDRYYTTLFYDNNKSMEVFMQKDNEGNSLIFVKGNKNFSTKGFIGPKDHDLLNSIDPNLVDVIEYGWFTFIAKPVFLLLHWLHGYINNWGWAIVVMTLLIRVVLFPLTFKGMVSMNKLKELAPKMKELQVKYKGEPQKLNAHVMELYKKHGANPMGGCIPIIIQIPIFFAIYRVLLNAIELKGAQWILWIHDLAIKDPYYVLPILMGITMFIQQKVTPTNFTDPMQEKIMKFLPLVFTFFFVTFPAGLTLYWFTNNLCSVTQQLTVNRIFKKHKLKEIMEKKHHES